MKSQTQKTTTDQNEQLQMSVKDKEIVQSENDSRVIVDIPTKESHLVLKQTKRSGLVAIQQND